MQTSWVRRIFILLSFTQNWLLLRNAAKNHSAYTFAIDQYSLPREDEYSIGSGRSDYVPHGTRGGLNGRATLNGNGMQNGSKSFFMFVYF